MPNHRSKANIGSNLFPTRQNSLAPSRVAKKARPGAERNLMWWGRPSRLLNSHSQNVLICLTNNVSEPCLYAQAAQAYKSGSSPRSVESAGKTSNSLYFETASLFLERSGNTSGMPLIRNCRELMLKMLKLTLQIGLDFSSRRAVVVDFHQVPSMFGLCTIWHSACACGS